MIICFFCLSCEKIGDANVLTFCDSKSIDDLQWVQDIKEGKTQCTIYSGAVLTAFSSDNDNLFLLYNGASSLYSCNQMVYNCSGHIISSDWTIDDWNNFKLSHTKGTTIWQKK
ncbi:MAG TPA: hypothetical protein VL125_01745 [Pelobium sp.]|nr:hypothetical protein [Pelobium sp.]